VGLSDGGNVSLKITIGGLVGILLGSAVVGV